MGPKDMQDVINSLIEFVKRASKESATPEEVSALPNVAKILTDYWLAIRPR